MPRFVRVFVLLLLITQNGCAGIVAGALIAEGSAHRGQKQRFLSELQATNTQREKDGMKPLDFCSQCYWFDKGWAMEDPICAKRIRRYQAGDSTALDPPGLALTTTVVSVPDSVQHLYDDSLRTKERNSKKLEWEK